MRHALLGLLALAGCNEIWRLGRDVELRDGGFADADPRFPRVKLTAQVTTTTAEGYAEQVPSYQPIDPPPAVQIGRLGEPLETVDYRPEGTVAYPVEFTGSTWRLVYTLADGIPRELQWSPPAGDLVAHVVEPLFGRPERPDVPNGGGYSITPMGVRAQHVQTRVYTTGIWTEGVTPDMSTSPTFDYKFREKAISLSGRLGAPERAKGDHGILADFSTPSGCRVASGVAAFLVPDMVDGSLSVPAPQPQWFSADKQARVQFMDPPVGARLANVIGNRTSGATDIIHVQYGYVPSLGAFGFSKPAPVPAIDVFLPGPQLILFAGCTFPPVVPPTPPIYQTATFADAPEIRERFPAVVHVEVVDQRVKGLVTLTSGYSAVLTSSSYVFTTEFPVAAPTGITLRRGGATVNMEDVALESTPIPGGAEPLELLFGVENNPLLGADYFDVTLHAIESGNLKLQRIYTVTERKVTIDPSVLRPNTEYVFEVRSYRGRPDVARANFTVNTYPQYAATVFTRTFKTP